MANTPRNRALSIGTAAAGFDDPEQGYDARAGQPAIPELPAISHYEEEPACVTQSPKPSPFGPTTFMKPY